MKLAFQLAYKNLVGAGLRTWLNVGVLAFSFIIIIFYNGLIDGWNEQAKHDSIAWEYGNGQLLHADYDPFDPFTILDGHGVLENELSKNLAPILLRQASIYPEGRMFSVALKGIDVNQTTLKLPTASLKNSNAKIPAMMGINMADAANLKKGDEVLLRWRDQGGTFDAAKITVVDIFETNVPTVDMGQVWIPIRKMWEMTGLENHTTFYVANENFQPSNISGWKYQSQETLLSDLNEIIAMKKISGSIMYLLLLAIALLAIFDTQVLSVFRRQKEIGTYISLGMTRAQVVGLFTVEGSMYSIFAMILGSIVGIPLFAYLAKIGIGMPAASRDMGVPLAERIFPVFGIQLIVGTILLVVIASTIVSFLPARKIAKMNPVLALKGKLQ
ncbi:MAG: FtsX-like permease family protein [Saprospiraceae bacterium]|nr:FtsX-like permease family protein [bacterium]MDG1434389.1 FtsX-like permease family protein [Saprospiraceae bacterium]MDG2419462.1 FtsX-like permease family protein [Saprospiraceae bacterium]